MNTVAQRVVLCEIYDWNENDGWEVCDCGVIAGGDIHFIRF